MLHLLEREGPFGAREIKAHIETSACLQVQRWKNICHYDNVDEVDEHGRLDGRKYCNIIENLYGKGDVDFVVWLLHHLVPDDDILYPESNVNVLLG